MCSHIMVEVQTVTNKTFNEHSTSKQTKCKEKIHIIQIKPLNEVNELKLQKVIRAICIQVYTCTRIFPLKPPLQRKLDFLYIIAPSTFD